MPWIGTSEDMWSMIWRVILEDCSRWIQWRIGSRCPWKYYFLWRIDAAVVSICQDIVDKSSPWNSESASHARSLQLVLLLRHPPCFSLRRPVHHLGRSQSRSCPSLVGLHLFHLIFGRPLFFVPGIFVLNSFLSVCSSSLLVTALTCSTFPQ